MNALDSLCIICYLAINPTYALHFFFSAKKLYFCKSEFLSILPTGGQLETKNFCQGKFAKHYARLWSIPWFFIKLTNICCALAHIFTLKASLTKMQQIIVSKYYFAILNTIQYFISAFQNFENKIQYCNST